MMQPIETVVDEKGRIHLLESVELKSVLRAFVTLLPDKKKPIHQQTKVSKI